MKPSPFLKELFGQCQSPVEKAFLQGLLDLGWEPHEELGGQFIVHPEALGTIVVQAHVRANSLIYVTDFYFDFFEPGIACADGKATVAMAIEIDGHRFHQTKEAVARDCARDRAFAKEGTYVLRFTGAEVHGDAWRCAQEAHDISQALCARAINRYKFNPLATRCTEYPRGEGCVGRICWYGAKDDGEYLCEIHHRERVELIAASKVQP